MRPDTRQARDDPGERLLRLALARPAQAYAEATRQLAAQPDPGTASTAHQARAIVVRDRGDQAGALRELRRALRLAQRSVDPRRVADVRATLGLTLGLGGRTREGLAMLDLALDGCRGVLAGRILMRRASLLRTCGRYEEALADLRRAIALLRRAGDQVWEARSRSHRFLVYAAVGQAARADRDLVIAERLFGATGQDLERAMAVHNRADLAFQVGDLPAALGFLDEAEASYEALQAYRPTLPIDRCQVLLAAGLATEAFATTEQALGRHLRRGAEATRTAELLFAVATAAQAAGRPEVAAERAAAARTLFRRQHRRAWQARAAFVELQTLTDAGASGERMRRRAIVLADELNALRAPEAGAADLLAARLCAARHRDVDADRHLARSARARHRGPSFGRAAGWLAQAQRAEARGSANGLLTACRLGLRAAAEHQRGLAAPDLRAHAAAYGHALAAMAQRHAVRQGDAWMLLTWSERWRASALALPPARPPDDKELAADLTALRGVLRRLDQARLADEPTDTLEQQRRRLEAAIGARARRRPVGGEPGPDNGARDNGTRDNGTRDADQLGLLLDGLAGHRLVDLAIVDDRIYVTSAVGRRVHTHPAGTLEAAAREVEHSRFLLRRIAYGRPSRAALRDLAAAGSRLQELLLGPAAADIDGPTVVVPPARLHTVPWSLLPALRRVPTVVAPSALMWLRAGQLPRPRRRRMVVAVGPGLPGTAMEAATIARGYPDAVVLSGGTATVEATLDALDGAFTAHIAAHGRFRADNPLFTSLSLADGPLTIYDLGRLRRAPRQLVLSSCESAVAAPVGSDELIGAMSALAPLGTASMLASIVPVNDVATGPVMADFHARLLAGEPFGAALCAARAAADATADPVAIATAVSFIAVGR